MAITINRKLPKMDMDIEYPAAEKVPTDWYNLEVTDVKISTNSVSNDERLEVWFNILDGEHSGKKVRNYFSIFTKEGAVRAFQFMLRSMGYTQLEIDDMWEDTTLLNSLIGCKIKGYISDVTLSNGKTYSLINKYRQPDPQYANKTDILKAYKEQRTTLDRIVTPTTNGGLY